MPSSAIDRPAVDLEAIEGVKLEVVALRVEGVPAAEVTLVGKRLEEGERITFDDATLSRVLRAISEKRPVSLPMGLKLDEQALRVRIDDRPGALASLLQDIAGAGGNVMHLTHARTGSDLAFDQVTVSAQVETKGPEHCAQVMAHLRATGYQVQGD